jgi:hypothetical protein
MKLTFTPKIYSYSEAGQTNPIKWIVLKQTDTGFENQSGWLKCKDFFNDWVFTRETTTPMKIYGFNTGDMTDIDKTKSGFLGIKDYKPEFLVNMKVLNKFLPKPIKVQEVTSSLGILPILDIPVWYMKNTYRISLLSLLIRLCNVNVSHKDWDSFLKYKNNTQDQHLFDTAIKKDLWFKPNKKVEKYVWYCGKDYNNIKTPVVDTTLVHNNGLCNWGEYL